MTRWWTADLHFGHENIIRYCDRPFSSVAAMDEGLIGRWNALVAGDDEVWVLGDVCLGGVAAHLPLVGRLTGRKILVPGNHDPCWGGHKKGVERWTETFLEAGFAEVVQPPTTAVLAGVEVGVDHFPYRSDAPEGDRYAEHRPSDRGGWLLHGHVHDEWRVDGRQVNVGVDAWGGCPVEDGALVALLGTGPTRLGPLSWT